jgi:hypothetical protein
MSQPAHAVPVPVSRPLPRPWLPWRIHFERQRLRPCPPLDPPPSSELSPHVGAAIAWSLARFQIGEVGEGRVVAAVARSTMASIDDDYRQALALFIREEGRHAAILASCVRALGGQLLGTTWTERGFVHVRRLAGIRFKLLAMFAAEVVGIGFYGALAGALPPGPVRAALEQIPADERAHLAIHPSDFTLQASRAWRRALFLAAWYSLAPAAALVVLLDHRRTLRTLGIPTRLMAARLWSLIREGAR